MSGARKKFPVLDSLKEAIFGAIESNDLGDVQTTLIALRKTKHYNPNDMSLHIDNEGRTFLHYALELNHLEIFKHFLEQQSSQTEIMFHKTHEGQTILMQAIENAIVGKDPAFETLAELLDLTMGLAIDTKATAKIWLAQDNNGDSILHLAATSSNIELLKFLISVLSSAEELKSLINLKNNQGHTPLSGALLLTNQCNPQVITLLMNNGAMLDEKDTHIQDQLKRFSNMSQDDKKYVLFNLTESATNLSNKTIIRKHLKELVLKNPDDKPIRDIYLFAESRHSLFALLCAHHEVNPDVPLRETYVSNPALENEDEREISILEIEGTKKLSDHMPRFFKRLITEKAALMVQHRQYDYPTNPDMQKEIDHELLLQNELKTLTSLLHDVESAKNNLRQPNAERERIAISASLTLLVFGAFAALTAHAITQAINHTENFIPTIDNTGEKDQSCSLEWNHYRVVESGLFFRTHERICEDANLTPRVGYSVLAAFSILAGLSATFIAAWAANRHVSVAKITFRRDDVNSLIDSLTAIEPHLAAHPIYSAIRKELTDNLAELSTNITRSRAADIFESIETALNTVVATIQENRQLIGLPAANNHAVIEIIDDVEINDEDNDAAPLLLRR